MIQQLVNASIKASLTDLLQIAAVSVGAHFGLIRHHFCVPESMIRIVRHDSKSNIVLVRKRFYRPCANPSSDASSSHFFRVVASAWLLNAFARQRTPMAQIRSTKMTPEEFHIVYPKVQAWVQKTLATYEKDAQPIASMHFPRLPLYFDHTLLETAKFIPIDRVPMPPPISNGARSICRL